MFAVICYGCGEAISNAKDMHLLNSCDAEAVSNVWKHMLEDKVSDPSAIDLFSL